MKKLLFLTFILLFVTSCINNSEKRAKKLIKEHLKSTMNDYSSYEPMEFSKLDSTINTNFKDSDKGKMMFKKIDSLSNEQMFILLSDPVKYEQIEKAKSEINIDIAIAAKAYKPEFIGLNMGHQFRGANAFGGKIIGMMLFYFDKDITTVTDVVDLNEKLRNFE